MTAKGSHCSETASDRASPSGGTVFNASSK